MNIKQVNKILKTETNNNIKIFKGKGYFYFMSKTGFVPESIYTNNIKNITLSEIKKVVNKYNESI